MLVYCVSEPVIWIECEQSSEVTKDFSSYIPVKTIVIVVITHLNGYIPVIVDSFITAFVYESELLVCEGAI